MPVDPITAYISLGITAGEWITLQGGITSIPHIPRHACEEWKSCFITVIREAIAKHDTERREAAFNLLLLLPALLLTHESRKRRKPLLRDVVKRRCRLFLRGQLMELVQEREDQRTEHARYWARRAGRALEDAGGPTAAKHRKHIARIVRLVNAGQCGKARDQLLSPGIAEPSLEVLQQLRDKHPDRQRPIDWGHISAVPSEPILVTWDTLEEVLQTTPKLSGPGPSALRADHVKSLLYAPTLSGPDKAALAEFFNDVVNARVPQPVLDSFLTASLIPILKSPTSSDVRPVAIGETIIKIAGRCILKTSRQKINAKLMSGFQLGEGVPAGLEAVSHSIRLLLDREPTFLALSLDMRNAFNTIRRADIAEQLVKQDFPELIPYFKMCYDKTSKLRVRMGPGVPSEEVVSAEGTRQGDPLAGTFFNLGFLHILQALIQRFPLVTPFGIHDDVTLVGPPAEVVAAFEWVIQAIPVTTGLAVQPTKTIATCPTGKPTLDTLTSADSAVQWMPPVGEPIASDGSVAYIQYRPGLVVAGVPIGPEDFVVDFLTSVHTESLKLSEAINTVKAEGFLQQGFLLDYFCLRPRVNHLFRSLPPRLTSDLASQHDALMLSALSTTLDTPTLDPQTVQQVRLPQSGAAGLSFTASTDVAPIAYVASMAGAVHVMSQIPPVCRVIDSIISSPDLETPPPSVWGDDFQNASDQTVETTGETVPSLSDLQAAPIKSYQSKLTERLKADSIDTFLESLSPYDVARVTSAGAAGASSWMTSPPGCDQQAMSSEQFQSALLWRLGLPQHATHGIHKCSMGDRHPVVDREGVHFVNLNCGSANSARYDGLESLTGEWRTIKHDACASVFTEFIHAAGFRTQWQPGWLPGMPPERKGDIKVFDYPSAGRSLIIDVTCVGPYTSTRCLNHTPDGLPVCAARIAEEKKDASYAALDRSSLDFLPLALDVFGGLAPRADDFVRRLASIVVTRRTGYSEGPHFSPKYAILLNKWRTRLSLTLNREIANAIFEGARNARGGERQSAAGQGVMVDSVHNNNLFEPFQFRL